MIKLDESQIAYIVTAVLVLTIFAVGNYYYLQELEKVCANMCCALVGT